jgi:hypothetical protein
MRTLHVGIVAAALVIAGTGGAVAAGSLVTSRQIANNTIRSVDLRDGAAVRWSDLTPALKGTVAGKADKTTVQAEVDALKVKHAADIDALKAEHVADIQALSDEITFLKQENGAFESRISALEDDDGVNTNWYDIGDGAMVDNENQVRVNILGEGGSVEIDNLHLAVDARDTIEFTYCKHMSSEAPSYTSAPTVTLYINDNVVTRTGTWADGTTSDGRCRVTAWTGATPPTMGHYGVVTRATITGGGSDSIVRDLLIQKPDSGYKVKFR